MRSTGLDGDSAAALAQSGQPVTDATGQLVSQLMVSADQARAIREGRGLTRAATAERATRYDLLYPISGRDIEVLEADGRLPNAKYALARLDMVYRTDGRLGIDRTFNSRNRPGEAAEHFALEFPEYWLGHVWLQAHGPQLEITGVMELVWGQWKRSQHIRPGAVVTSRKAELGLSTLDVYLPKGWYLSAGTGVVPAALDINVGWRPTSLKAAWVAVRDASGAMRRNSRQQTPKTDEQ